MAEDSDSEVAGMTFSRAPPAVPAAAADDGLLGAESKKEAKIAATQRVKEEAARAAAAHQELLDSFGSGEELNLVHTVIFRRPKHLVELEYIQMPDEKERQDTIKRDTANTVGFWRGDKHHHGGRELNVRVPAPGRCGWLCSYCLIWHVHTEWQIANTCVCWSLLTIVRNTCTCGR